MFYLLVSGTELSKVPGLSAAGSSAETVRFTASADADIARFGRSLVTDRQPFDPQGHPSPAIITHAALKLARESCLVVDVGTYRKPTPPYVELGACPGRDPRLEPAVPDADAIADAGRQLARAQPDLRHATIAESVPGGTTTALLVMRALGVSGMVSSAGPHNPIALKEEIWAASAKRLGIAPGAFEHRPLDAVRELGDPMQAAAFGMADELLRRGESVMLAGGTQMLAVAALLRASGCPAMPVVATTPYVARDASSSFAQIARELGVETRIAPLDLSSSRFKGLADYELGFVKEGVGAGGAVVIAADRGASPDDIRRAAEDIYESFVR